VRREVLEELGREALARREGVVVADENDVRLLAGLDQLPAREPGRVREELTVVVADVLAPDVGIGAEE